MPLSNTTISLSYTAVQNCTNGTVRLVDGPVENAGRVEVCINGVWGTVCHRNVNDWGNNDARVVCGQLGYSVNTGGGELFGSFRLVNVARSQRVPVWKYSAKLYTWSFDWLLFEDGDCLKTAFYNYTQKELVKSEYSPFEQDDYL